jgi:hypothetical protein
LPYSEASQAPLFTGNETSKELNRQKKPNSQQFLQESAYRDYHSAILQQDNPSDIIFSVLSSILKADTLVRLRASIKQLVGIDLLDNEILLSQPELFEYTLYMVLGPSAKLIFEKITNKLVKQFCNTIPCLQYDDRYNEIGDYARMISAIRNNTNISLRYS